MHKYGVVDSASLLIMIDVLINFFFWTNLNHCSIYVNIYSLLLDILDMQSVVGDLSIREDALLLQALKELFNINFRVRIVYENVHEVGHWNVQTTHKKRQEMD